MLDWRTYARSNSFPDDIPKNPDRGYAADGWIDWGDWLGTGKTRPWRAKYRSFEDARSFVRGLGLRNWREYARSGQRPKDIPSSPEIAYAKDGWAGIDDWLGYVRSGDRNEARSKKGTGEAPAPTEASI